MLKQALFVTAIALLAFSAAPKPVLAQDVDDVFIDEGNEDVPEPMPASKPDPASKSASKPVGKPASEPVEDDGADTLAASDDATEPSDEAAPEKSSQTLKADAKPKVEKKAAKTAKASGNKKEGFRMLKADCEMRREPASDSPVVITVKGERKLWVEDVDGQWVKGFRKKGHGYMASECFE